MIDRLTIERITEIARIEDVVSDFVALKRAGVNLKGLCPFHDDRTPSFIVSPAKNYCKCFACGAGGNPVTFIMKHEQISYPEALKYLAKKYGIEIKEKELTPEEHQRNDDRESMFILNEWAKKWFREQLLLSEEGKVFGLSYFHQRGFRDDILERFQVGYCPNNKQFSLSTDAQKAGFQKRFLINTPNEQDIHNSIGTGLSFQNERGELRDRFFGRVVWPIFTISGKVAGFGGRVLDTATKGVNIKYQNSPESIIYSKRRELYGLFQAKQAIVKYDLCYLVEGYTDVMAMHQIGIENVVSSSGTALTEEQIRLIHRLTGNIVVIYDGDEAGIKASQRGIDMLLAQGMNVKLLLLPENEDPDSFARKHNATYFLQYLKENQVDFIKFKTNLLIEEGKNDPMTMSQLVNNIVQSIAVIPDEITRTLYVRETASMIGISESLIAKAISKQVNINLEEWRKAKEREKRYTKQNRINSNDLSSPTKSESPEEKEWSPLPESEYAAQIQPKAQEIHNQDLSPSPSTNTTDHNQLRLENKERELLRAVVRYGEQQLEFNNGTKIEHISVISYIAKALEQDNLEIQNEMYRKLFSLAQESERQENFSAEKYFLSYPDEAINSLAFELANDKEQLSKLHTEQHGKYEMQEDNTVSELIPHLLADYKLEIVTQKLYFIMKQLKDKNLLQDKEKYTQVMTSFIQLKDIERRLAQIRGDRVIR